MERWESTVTSVEDVDMGIGVVMVQDQRTGRACGLCNTLGLSGPKPGAAMWNQLCAKGVPDNACHVK